MMSQSHAKRRYNGSRDFFLDREDVRQLPIVALRPQLVAVLRTDQLRADSEPVPALSNASLDDRRNAQLSANLADVGIRILELKGGGPGGDLEAINSAQGRDQFVGQSVAEVLLVLLLAEVGEWQDGRGGRCR